jgi:hypothetical protein
VITPEPGGSDSIRRRQYAFGLFRFLFEHDLFGKPVSTFPDHALSIGYERIAADVTRTTAFYFFDQV